MLTIPNLQSLRPPNKVKAYFPAPAKQVLTVVAVILQLFQLFVYCRRQLPVEIGGSRAGYLLLALSHVEKHGLVRLWPLEVKAFLDAVSWWKQGNSICFFVFRGVHRTLYLVMYQLN